MEDLVARLKAALADRYTIQRELGHGGMATVYLAQDLKHDREVAVKVLRPELSAVLGGERFLREIHLAAKLNHPHILALFDSGEAEGFLYYVMPHVAGESLRDKLNRERQLPIDETIALTQQVAGALDYAHAEGVIHRDIKPENILIYQGEALVADFGIALAVSAAGGTRLTDTGLSLGTPEYMSPEQATGERELDARSDMYSLGAVVYEMLVGEPPHTGNTVQAIIAKVVSVEPQPVSSVRHSVPGNVDAAVQCALAKTPADRFSSGAELADALTNPTFALPTATVSGYEADRPSSWGVRRAWWGAAIGAAAIAAGTVGLLIGKQFRPAFEFAPRIERWTVSLADDAPLDLLGGAPLGVHRAALDLSPDGSRLVYVTDCGGVACLRVQPTDRYVSFEIAGTEGAYGPFFSPDGEWIGFFSGGRLLKVRVSGGAPVELCPATNPHGAHWGDRDSIVFADNEGRVLRRVASEGGEPRVVLTGATRRWPVILPGGDMLIHGGYNDLIAVSLSTGDERVLIEGGRSPRFVAPDQLLFARGSRLFAGRLDETGFEFQDTPREIAQDVLSVGLAQAAQYAVSGTGLLVYASGSVGNRGRLVWVDRDGNTSPLPFEPGVFGQFDISPDGTQLAIPVITHYSEVWLYDLGRGSRSLLTSAEPTDTPLWAPDGSWIAVRTVGTAGPTTGRVRVDGRGRIESIVGDLFPSSFSPDGSLLAGLVLTDTTLGDIWVTTLQGQERSEPVVASPAFEWGAVFSPDGRWLAYTSDESGAYQIYVEPFPQSGDRWQISIADGSEEPMWSPDGRQVYYRQGRRWMAVSVQTEPVFEADIPRVLFEGDYLNLAGRSHALSPDGKRFLLVEQDEEAPTQLSRLRVVSNWRADPSRQVP
jgi:serine/threonine-protein kinase